MAALTRKKYTVEVVHPVRIGARKSPDKVSRYFTVYAKTARSAAKAVQDAGHTKIQSVTLER